MKSSRGLQSCCLAGSFCRVAWEWQEQQGGCGYIISLQEGLEGKNPCCWSSLLGLCPNSPEVGGEILGQEKARTGMIQVSEKQPLSGVQKMPLQPGKMLALPKAEWRSRGWRRELGTSAQAAAGSQRLQTKEEAVCFGFCACVFAATPREDTVGSELTSLVNFLYSFWPFITLRSGGFFYF